MAIIVLLTAALAFFCPSACLWVQTSWINYLLMLVMFGMGLTLKFSDFRLVFARPRDVAVGCVAQFAIMPLLAFALARLFRLDPALTAGVVLVGACPGGTASNVVTYLARGDVALSVGMTAVNTLLAPLLTPLIAYFLLRTTVSVDASAMFLSILQVVVAPLAVGFFVDWKFGRFAQRIAKALPAVSIAAISLIVAAVVSHNAGRLRSTGATAVAVVVLHNLLGYAGGFGVARALKMSPGKTKALSIEVGMQNSGLATVLAASVFPGLPLATTPGAIFSVWHNVSGAILANLYKKWGSAVKESNAETPDATRTRPKTNESTLDNTR